MIQFVFRKNNDCFRWLFRSSRGILKYINNMTLISYDDFLKVEICVGTILSAQENNF